MEQKCRTCGEIKVITEFYTVGPKADCKSCAKAKARANRRARLADVREYDRQRAKDPHRKAKAAANLKRWRAANPNRVNKDRRDHPEKYKARTAVSNAIRDKKLTKGPCEVCGSTEKVQAHHRDYSKPLEVSWRCVKHRIDEHEDDWMARRRP
jgi:hypothetical protein